MLYCVSYPNGAVGVFSSMEKVKELVFDKYPSLIFVTQIFKSSKNSSNSNLVWIVMYKDNEVFAFVSDDKEESLHAVKVFDKIGKAYEEVIEYYEQEIDVISECVESILHSLQRVYGETGLITDSSMNVISYV